jgi:DNA mismatch repair protein MSH2
MYECTTTAFARGGEYVKPHMTALGQKGNIVLKQARHPCMECNDGMNFIPNDYNMDREKK